MGKIMSIMSPLKTLCVVVSFSKRMSSRPVKGPVYNVVFQDVGSDGPFQPEDVIKTC